MSVGEEAVAFARRCVEAEVRGEHAALPEAVPFREMRGVFVTLSTFPSGDLRGCIGYPYPVMTLGEALGVSAESACHDPRFPDLDLSECDRVTVEVTILSVPRELECRGRSDIRESVKVGRDGLMIELMGHRGLLLPQVPVEWGWNAEQYLSHLSMKAGLPPDAWMHPDARLWSFEGEIYSEETPNGNISKRDI